MARLRRPRAPLFNIPDKWSESAAKMAEKKAVNTDKRRPRAALQ
jgi:hypothetical protein